VTQKAKTGNGGLHDENGNDIVPAKYTRIEVLVKRVKPEFVPKKERWIP
jgi:hypothetical protein